VTSPVAAGRFTSSQHSVHYTTASSSWTTHSHTHPVIHSTRLPTDVGTTCRQHSSNLWI